MNIVYKINLWFKDRWYDLELMWRYDKFGWFSNVILYPFLVGFNLVVGFVLLSVINFAAAFVVAGLWVFVWKTSMRTVGHRKDIERLYRMPYDWGNE